MTLSKKDHFILWCVFLGVVIFFLAVMKWGGNSYYTASFSQGSRGVTPMQKEAVKTERHGVSEKDIQKSRGRRFNAF